MRKLFLALLIVALVGSSKAADDSIDTYTPPTEDDILAKWVLFKADHGKKKKKLLTKLKFLKLIFKTYFRHSNR
jgi:hypothetical protein